MKSGAKLKSKLVVDKINCTFKLNAYSAVPLCHSITTDFLVENLCDWVYTLNNIENVDTIHKP